MSSEEKERSSIIIIAVFYSYRWNGKILTTNARSFFNDQKWTKKNTHKENTIRGAKRDHESATTGALSFFFFCRVLLERRERNRDCFYGNGYISRDVFVNFLSPPFCKKNGPKNDKEYQVQKMQNSMCSLFVYTQQIKKLQGLN